MYYNDKLSSYFIIMANNSIILYLLVFCRSSKFYQCLEQNLVSGGTVLIESFPCRTLDPSLLPLLSLKHNWRDRGTGGVVQQCKYKYLRVAIA